MKRMLLGLAVLALVIAVTAGTAQKIGTSQGAQDKKGERHPVIRRSMRQLEGVKRELQAEAARDFQGHRANAVKLIEQAVGELNQALQAD